LSLSSKSENRASGVPNFPVSNFFTLLHQASKCSLALIIFSLTADYCTL
jgi:hypothetical protein